MVTLSMGSRLRMLCDEASTATVMNQLGSTPSATNGSFSESLLAVRVPVLSEHRISTPASDSMA